MNSGQVPFAVFLRRVARKIASTFAKQAQNAKGEMHLAMEPSPEWSVSGVRTAETNQPSQKPRNLRRVTTKIASTFAKQAQNANVPTVFVELENFKFAKGIWAKLAQQSEFAKGCDNQMGRSGQETYYLAVLYNFWQGVDCIYGL